ncbi:hypothetical protein [Empedobacter sp. UBA7248]|uniref:hypothetical protein n=1 Tax=Empedobacter sp. UBA7248 TaxID=1946448 RepID=UPI0025C073B9|nr:hypothetical protein [Empedobacter sp. UBA7248]
MKRIIRICFLFLSVFIFSSCKAQQDFFVFGNEKSTHQSSKIADIVLETNNLYLIKFKKSGEFRLDNIENNVDQFEIILDNSIIMFKYPYKLIVRNYQGRNAFKINLEKKSKNEYQLILLQYTKHTTIDKFYLKRVNNKFVIYKIENIQPGEKYYICEYPKLIYQDKKTINLSQESINLNCVSK